MSFGDSYARKTVRDAVGGATPAVQIDYAIARAKSQIESAEHITSMAACHAKSLEAALLAGEPDMVLEAILHDLKRCMSSACAHRLHAAALTRLAEKLGSAIAKTCPWGTRGTVDCAEFGGTCDGARCGVPAPVATC